jgi:hypothetical protein
MAVISEISGVSTSGTSGINNIFGSGGGGGTATPNPTVTIGRSTTYTGNSLTVTNTASYTDVRWKVNILNPSSVVIGTEDDCTFGVDGTGNVTISWTILDGTGTHSVELWAQEFGDFIDSAKVTETYTVAAAQFEFWRIYIADSSKTKIVGASKYVHVDEWELFEGGGQTGVVHPNVNLTSNTSSADYEATRGHTQYNYPAYKAFDGGSTTNTWTLGATSGSVNWLELEFKQATTPSISSVRINGGNQMGGNLGSYWLIECSTTGAWAGEEVEYAHVPIVTTGATVNIG